MLWFKTKKDEEINYDKYLEEFIRFKDSKDKEAEYKAISKLYKEIYVFYKSLINDDQFDIKAEKLLLERRSGRYTSEKSKNNVTILIGMACALVPIYVQGFSELNMKYKAIISIIAVVGIFYMVGRDIVKDVIRDKNRDVMYNICFKVLDDIDKEMKKGTDKIIRNNEVAATRQIIETKEPLPQSINGKYNLTLNFNYPSILDIMAKRVLKKKK